MFVNVLGNGNVRSDCGFEHDPVQVTRDNHGIGPIEPAA